MAQPFPYFQNGQNPINNGKPGMLPMPMGQPSSMMPVPNANPGIAGVDPAMMAAAQQSLENPNAGDSMFPGPADALKGGLAGMAMAASLGVLEDQGVINKVITNVDKIPGVSRLSQALDKGLTHVATAKTGYWSQNGWLQDSVKELIHAPLLANKSVSEAMRAMEKRHLNTTLGNFQKWVNGDPQVRSAYQKMLKNSSQVASKLQEKEFLSAVQGKIIAKEGAKVGADVLAPLAKLDLLDPKKLDSLTGKSLKQVHNAVVTQVEALKTLSGKTGKEKYLLRRLETLGGRLSGIKSNYGTLYKEQAKVIAQLQAKKVGPIGRFFANGLGYIKRILSGETMKAGTTKAAKKGLWANIKSQIGFGPFLAGTMFFGTAFQAASKAKKGEKTKTFFHNFFGVGISNFIGWEVGRKLLNSFNVFGKLLGKRGSGGIIPKFLAPVIRRIPLVGNFISTITLAGFLTELAAMFIVGSQFQKVGEKIAHKIFGKPSEESLNGGQKPQEQASQMASNAATSNYLPQKQAMAANGPMGPMIAPGMQGMWGQANPAAFQNRQMQPVQPQPIRLTLTPDQIRKSPAAEAQQQFSSNLMRQLSSARR